MKGHDSQLKGLVALLFAMVPGLAGAFTSGSTGADGPFNPTVSTEVQLPPGGIFNFTTVNIPAGVVVKFKRNAANAPVTLLASGDVTIAGAIDIRGFDAPGVGAAGGGSQGDDGQPGKGGPGGFDGGKGGAPVSAGFAGVNAGAGLGPGGGNPGFSKAATDTCVNSVGWASGGTGGGFGASAIASDRTSFDCPSSGYRYTQAAGGAAYGSSLLLPMIGGSGGAGGGGGPTYDGGGGGGGGGAILIAASGTVNVTGAILANGGAGAAASGAGIGGAGGGGAGGAIRIVATTIAGNGTINAAGGASGTLSGQTQSVYGATAGAVGRVRLEAESITRTAATTPAATSDLPGAVFIAGFPTLTIASVAGVAAPASPTGAADITLPASTQNPVTIVVTTTNVPVGNTVRLTVTPAIGATSSAISPALTGTTESATASVQISLPVGPSVLQAQTAYTIVASLGDALAPFAGNERVERIAMSAILGGQSKTTLITVSGKEFDAPPEALRIAAMGR